MDALDNLMQTIGHLSRWATQNSDLGVTPVTGRLLSMIDQFEPARISTLAKADGVAQPTMTTHVQRLVDEGLVSRAGDPQDARAVLVTLTERGRETLARVRAARSQTLASHIAGFSGDERARLAEAAGVLDDLLRRVNEPRV